MALSLYLALTSEKNSHFTASGGKRYGDGPQFSSVGVVVEVSSDSGDGEVVLDWGRNDGSGLAVAVAVEW